MTDKILGKVSTETTPECILWFFHYLGTSPFCTIHYGNDFVFALCIMGQRYPTESVSRRWNLWRDVFSEFIKRIKGQPCPGQFNKSNGIRRCIGKRVQYLSVEFCCLGQVIYTKRDHCNSGYFHFSPFCSNNGKVRDGKLIIDSLFCLY